MRAFFRRHPVLSYYLLTFAISWGGVFLATGTSFATREEFERLMPIWVVLLVAGPSISGILMTALVDGRRGLRDYRSRLLAWRVEPRWTAVALFAAPLYFLVALLAMSLFSPDYLPVLFTTGDKASIVGTGIAVGLVAGIFEELGWTGFALPALRKRHGLAASGLIAGVLWGLWHFPVKIASAGAFGLLPYLPADLLQTMVGLTAFRILMARVYERTGSLLLAIVMHFSLTAANIILAPSVPGLPLAIASLVMAFGWWAVVAAVSAAGHWRTAHARHAV